MTMTTTATNPNTLRSTVLRIELWNVRTLCQAGKLDNVIHEMNRVNLQWLGLCEVRWPGTGDCNKDGKCIFYPGGANNQHQHGVALVLDRLFAEAGILFWPRSDRVLLVKIKACPFSINIIVVYAPRAEAEDREIEECYQTLEEVYSRRQSLEEVYSCRR